MFKRVGSIVLTAVLMFTMVCSTFALSDPMYLEVGIAGDVTEVDAGDTLTVNVDMGVSGTLSGMTILGTYNTDVFTLEESGIVAANMDGQMAVTPVIDPSLSEGQVKVNWLGSCG